MKAGKYTTIFLLTLCLSLTAAPSSTCARKKVRLNKKKLTLTVGKSYTLRLKHVKKKVKWSSSKKKVAAVTKKGKVKAVKAGTATITAKTSGKKYKCRVTVKEKAKSISPTPDNDNDNDFTTTVQTDYAANFEILKNYILTYGFTNESGDKVINGSYCNYDSDLIYGITYSTTEQAFTFLLASTHELDYDSTGISALSLSVTEASIANGTARFYIVFDSEYYGIVNGSFPLSSIGSEENSLSWVTEEANLTGTEDLANSYISLAYASWELLLQEHSLMPLTDLGFGA